MVPFINIYGFPLTVSRQIFQKFWKRKKTKTKHKTQGPFKLSVSPILRHHVQLHRNQHHKAPSILLYPASFFFYAFSSLSILPIPLSLYFTLYPFALISPTPISKSTICSSPNRLQWWKRKGLTQSPLAKPGTAEVVGADWGKAWRRRVLGALRLLAQQAIRLQWTW